MSNEKYTFTTEENIECELLSSKELNEAFFKTLIEEFNQRFQRAVGVAKTPKGYTANYMGAVGKGKKMITAIERAVKNGTKRIVKKTFTSKT